MKALVVRAESSDTIGAGHAMRCLAIAQEWIRRGGQVIFLARGQLAWVSERLREEGCEVVRLSAPAGTENDAQETLELCRAKGGSRLVVDGYWTGSGFIPMLREFEPLVVDDFGGRSFAGARWLLNPGCDKHPDFYHYSDLEGVELLAGSKFLPIRREFLAAREVAEQPKGGLRNVLVTLGGGQTSHLAAAVTEMLLRCLPEETLIKVIATVTPEDGRLVAVAAASRGRVSISDISSEFPLLVSNADLVVCGAGSTTWEVCCLGRPAVLLVLADNQERVAASVKAAGAAVVVEARSGDFSDPLAAELSALTPERRTDMATRAAGLVDGLGASRIVDRIQ